MMVITRTPFRISFFGGGTDYPAFYQEHGGMVLNTTINKYCYLTCRDLPPFFDHRFRIRYTDVELTDTLEQIRHPSVKACLSFLNMHHRGIEMIHTSDIPARSGIGSSSAFTVGFLNALYALQGKTVTKRKLAFDAIHVEQDLIGEDVGSQDQIAAAFGGFNRIEFGGATGIFVQPVILTHETLSHLQSNLMLFFTGFSRNACEIAKVQIEQIPGHIHQLLRMKEMVDQAIQILNRGPDTLDEFGQLLHESWKLKKSLADPISNLEIDAIYETAIRAGAVGGKICGAGGGGFILFYVPPEKQQRVREALANLLLVPFRFETLASHIIFYTE